MNIYLGTKSMKTTKIQFAIASFRVVVLLLLMTVSSGCSLTTAGSRSNLTTAGPSHADPSPGPEAPTDEHLITAVVEVGPFLINTLYLSGEGPGRIRDISIEELIANKETVWVEPTLGLSKKLAEINAENPHFKAAIAAQNPAVGAATQQTPEQNRMTEMAPGQRLYWVRGTKLEIIEDGKILPHPEFLCHSLISFDSSKHREYFPISSGVSGNFMFNFSQGITNIIFPEDFGIPMNSNERLQFAFKSLNRTSDKSRLIKCRWTLYFVADSGLTRPIQALNWYHSGIAVLVGDATSKNRLLPGGCGARMCGLKGLSKGKTPPNDVLHKRLGTSFDKNEKGEEITWHWVIPPGRHSYRTMHPEHRFDLEGPIRAAGAHVHPFCEKMSLIEAIPGQRKKTVFTLHSRTDTSQGIRIMHIDYLTWPATGITLSKDKKAQYGWEVTYNNTSGVDQDSMAGTTLYFSDLKFQKPVWHDQVTQKK